MQELEKILEEAKMKEKIEKIKVSNAEIVVHGTKERPYYEIKYYDLLDNECHVGFSSYSLDIVFDWLSKCFEIVDKHMNDGWIPVEERLPEVGEHVLGTTWSGEILTFRYEWNIPHSKKLFFHLCGAAANVIAWRPLPEPYCPERRAK